MILTSAERILVHLHGQWNAKEPTRAMTQAGIADGAHVQRSHVPRSLKVLLEEGLVESREARLLGQVRRTTVYALTPSGVARAREILASADARTVEVDGRTTTLGEARRLLGLSPVDALAAVDARGRMSGHAPPSEDHDLLQRDEDLAWLRRWRTGAARVAVVYGSKGMGKTALARAFARTVDRSVWIDLHPEDDTEGFADSIRGAADVGIDDPSDPSSSALALAAAFDRGTRLLVIDGYGEVTEGIVDVLRAFVRVAPERADLKLLVLAQETTPAYCRFYGEPERRSGLVLERHVKGLDIEGCRTMLRNPAIREEDLRRIFLLTKGCPLFLQYIREGDEYGLRQNSRFTRAEIRLLLFSGRSAA